MSTQVTGPAIRDGLLIDPTAFLAKILNSYAWFCVKPDTVKFVSITLVKLAFVHLPFGASLLSTM